MLCNGRFCLQPVWIRRLLLINQSTIISFMIIATVCGSVVYALIGTLLGMIGTAVGVPKSAKATRA
ncbi:MAG: hypothetical protein CSA11_08650 [Chloroflexi bacterium]|nr:MAG: hypothetical protein CSB13_08610 [Chloroflexota bacterium]PIE80377.1 MAG: hypothetical protein CSA11_08650 [Chloroflexota bacterium]